jgi:hypothetical protein
MTRRPLRLWMGALLVIAVLFLPQVSMAQGLSLPIEVQGGFSALWGWLVGIFQGDEADNRGTIDPDGLTATDCQGEPCPGIDNRWTIDPDG